MDVFLNIRCKIGIYLENTEIITLPDIFFNENILYSKIIRIEFLSLIFSLQNNVTL